MDKKTEEGKKGRREDGKSEDQFNADPSSLILPPSPLSVPRSVSDIPGLGPIRIRALQKAGLGDLNILRETSLDVLTAVPGMSDIKARHVLDYLAPFSTDQLKRGNEGEIEGNEKGINAGKTGDGRQETREDALASIPLHSPFIPPSSPSSPSVAPSGSSLAGEAMLAYNLAASILTSAGAYEFRERLLRELARFSYLARTFAAKAAALNEKDQERAHRRLARALGELTEAAHAPPERKAQNRLADALDEASERLAGLLAQYAKSSGSDATPAAILPLVTESQTDFLPASEPPAKRKARNTDE